ncbi:hypothetical protein EXS65_01390 [Candidatus Peribacteria bacterium]|nr:hypothetical protein [Candidatus Peribacteria bacterium]
MSIPFVNAGWTNIDDDAPSVRITTGAAKKEETSAPKIHTSEPAMPLVHKFEKHDAAVQPNPKAMRLSAITGIAVVLIIVTMYLGVDTLRGSLTESGGTVTTVTVTAENTFSPATITIAAGTTLTLENKNPNPAVIKSKDTRELFPTQLLFDKPYTFTIPTGVSGTFTYVSETMPPDQTLMIIVTPSVEATALSSVGTSSTVASPADEVISADDFPLPFGGPMEPVANPNAAAVPEISIAPQATSPATTNILITEESDTTEIISVGATSSTQEKAEVSFGGNSVPTNPYTVGNKKAYGNAGNAIAAAANNLHSGAPLLKMQQYRPRTNTSTGPAAWGIFVFSACVMVMAYRRGIIN